MSESGYYSIPKLAKQVKISEKYIRGLIRRRELRFFRLSQDGKIVIRMEWFDDWAERQADRYSKVSRRAREFGDKILRKVS